ncbi:MAG: hypothetical protein KY468_17815 [Armatimonadetes bacterium]|nr:hypothetical protein [Armatimonadota bacterium]
MANERPSIIPFFQLSEEEEARLVRWMKGFGIGFLLFIAVLVLALKSGFFREQARMKQARAMIETGGYAYCAIWGDGTDPFQLMARNSPLKPRWSGERQVDGAYLMTFSYRKSGREYRHRWRVNLEEKRVNPAGEMSVPVRTKPGERACSEV